MPPHQPPSHFEVDAQHGILEEPGLREIKLGGHLGQGLLVKSMDTGKAAADSNEAKDKE